MRTPGAMTTDRKNITANDIFFISFAPLHNYADRRFAAPKIIAAWYVFHGVRYAPALV